MLNRLLRVVGIASFGVIITSTGVILLGFEVHWLAMIFSGLAAGSMYEFWLKEEE